MIQPILINQKYFDNTILDYLIGIGIFVSSLILVRIFKIVILKRLKVWAESTKIVTSNFSREIKMAHPTQTVLMSGNVVIDTGKDKNLIGEK